MGKVMFMRKGEVHTAPITIAEGTIWLYTEDGTFTVPADGNYQIEMHGGGGGGAYAPAMYGSTQIGAAGGGGSGEIYEVTLASGDSYSITIGAGGAGAYMGAGSSGGPTSFGSLYTLTGGSGGSAQYGGYPNAGSASGSIASAGSISYGTQYASGGYGNTNNTSQTYGNGGNVNSNNGGNAGQSGAVIITYLGKE